MKLLSVPELAPVGVEDLGSEIIPRSVALADFEGQGYVLCGLGDGQLHNWRLDPATRSMTGMWGSVGGVLTQLDMCASLGSTPGISHAVFHWSVTTHSLDTCCSGCITAVPALPA